VHDASTQSTYCSGCGEVLIERDWYRLGAYCITPDGACASCGQRVPGRFAAAKGTWGAKRLPVTMR
jgi:pyruvate formate lyase activating enzyme